MKNKVVNIVILISLLLSCNQGNRERILNEFERDINLKSKKIPIKEILKPVDIVISDDYIVIQNKGIRLFLNVKKGTLKDPENIMRDVSEVGHWGNGAYEIRFPLNSDVELDYVFNLLRQTMYKNKDE